MRNYYFGGYFGGLGTNVKFNGFKRFCEFLKVSVSIFWLKTGLTSNKVFSLILNIFHGVSSEKKFYFQITMVAGDIDAKKTRNLLQTSHQIFSQGLIAKSSFL